ncbi:MAG: helix-turn-helix domain-containing protein [Bacteroidota bacterium]
MEAALSAAPPPREFLGTPEAAEHIGISKAQMEEWRSKGAGPAYHKVGRRVVYSVADLRAFVARGRTEALR